MKKTKGQAKIQKVMHEYKTGDLKSSSGQAVTNPKQAIAIAMSEAGRAKKPAKGKMSRLVNKMRYS